MSDLVLGPITAANAAEIILRPNLSGAVDQPLLNGSGGGPGIHLMPGFTFPVVVNEHRFTESPFTEGRRRTGTRPQNAAGGGEVRFEGEDQGEFWEYVDDFQQTIAAINRVVGGIPAGGELEVTLTAGQTITFELESADLAEPTNLDRMMSVRHAIFGFTYECRPYGLLDAVELLDAPIVSSDPVVSIPVDDIPGQVEALTTITVADSEGQARDQVEYGVEENVDLDDLPPLAIEAAALVELGGSLVGSVIQADVGATALAICSTGVQSHQGRRKVKVHIEADTAETWVWLEYRIGDGPWTAKSPQLCLTGAVCERELGSISIPDGKTWEGRVVAMCEDGGTVEVKRVEPFPAAWYGVARREFRVETPTTIAASDSLEQGSSGTPLDGVAADAGGVWDTTGAAGDFEYDDTTSGGIRLVRETTNDASERTALLPAALANPLCQVEFVWETALPVSDDFLFSALLARDGDVQAKVRSAAGNDRVLLSLTGADDVELPGVVPGYVHILRLAVVGANAFAWVTRRETSFAATPQATSSGLPLSASGVGIADQNASADGITRGYTQFRAWELDADAACFADLPMHFAAEAFERRNQADTDWGRVPIPEGDYPRLPPSGRENLTHRIAVKADRNDLTNLPLGGDGDELTVSSVEIRPRVLLASRV